MGTIISTGADQDRRLALYTVLGNCTTEQLFWSILYLNSVAFRTPLRSTLRKTLLGLYGIFETALHGAYPGDQVGELVAEVARSNSLFVGYVDTFMRGSPKSGAILRQWQESGERMAVLLGAMNDYYQVAEWSAMLRHQRDLLDAMARDLRGGNYESLVKTVPVCHRLAVEMAQYMGNGILEKEQKMG